MDRRGSVSLSAATYLLGPMRLVVQADSHTVAPMPSNQSVTGFLNNVVTGSAATP